ncbi:hypothetical protein ACFL0R_04560 [Pseudomonadota bacterium]
MNKLSIYIISILTLTAITEATASGLMSTVFSKQDAPVLSQQCSRQLPGKLDGGWTPPESAIKELEKKMGALFEMETNLCCGQGKIEHDMQDYKYQYGGIIVNGEKQIYINAIHSSKKVGNWQKTAIVYCGGGKLLWGALFNPTTGVFSGLAFNGES